MRHRENGRDQDIEALVGELGAERTLDDHEFRTLARSAAGERAPLRSSGRRRRLPALRWVGAAVGAALLAGSGLGFGLGASLTPSGSAGTNFAGTGFLPARGWTVVQTGRVDTNGASRAIAANVPLRPEDAPGDLPYATLESLPPGGVVIVATFTTRGDAGADYAYPARTLPLQVSTATPVSGGVLTARPLGEFRLRAGVKGINVDAQIHYGVARPSLALRSAAQRQLNRLAVASEQVTIFARPSIVDQTTPAAMLFGSVDNGRAGEEVVIQAKDCGTQFFRVVAGTETRDGGGWSTQYYPGINTTLRAVWKEASSPQITMQQRVRVSLSKRPNGKEFYVAAGGRRSFWRKKVLIQRRSALGWATVKTVVLTDTYASKGYYASSATAAEFKVDVPKGTTIRAVMPRSQAKPCYLPAVSKPIRT